MKRILIAMSVFLIEAVIIYGLWELYTNEKSERKRFSDNYTAVLTEKAKQQELTFGELKKLYPEYDSLAKKLNIRTKNITNIIETQYRFRDTTITKTILRKDSISKKTEFSINDKCYSFLGYLSLDTIALTKKEFNDRLITFLYKDYEKRFLFFRIKPFYTAKVFSECMNDTVCVENNIKIKKR